MSHLIGILNGKKDDKKTLQEERDEYACFRRLHLKKKRGRHR